MSTRSRISYVTSEGKVRSIYCHNDGYLEGVGKTLLENYNDTNLNALMDLGNLSSLGTTPTTEPRRWDDSFMMEEYFKTGYDDSKCTSYRDRGDEDIDAEEFDSLEEFENSDCCEEYNYLFKNGNWFFWNGFSNKKPLYSLEKRLRRIK